MSFPLQLYPIPLQATPNIHSKISFSDALLSILLKITAVARVEVVVGAENNN